ncbi:MAG: prepilin-type N-terminal cleavage/methylation domain-containing protein [Oribacterium sp.]|nr:prepilin-type N-terminal cleavage/methylation domain-containing protein [Oribacterium sp.]
MFKKLNKKGFTLAELLIVVAIIGVLVAISIPIFTSQLEKAREATDEANIRAIYAQLTADVLTENTAATDCPAAKTYKVEKAADGVVTGTATYTMVQQKSGTEGDKNLVIGGASIEHDDFATGTCTIIIKSDGTPTSIAFS